MHPLRNAATLYNHLKAELLKAYPELDAEDETLLGTLEGESNIDRMIASVVRSIVEDELFAEALSQRTKDMRARQERLGRRAQTKRQLVASVMAEIGMKKLATDDMTISQGYTQPSVVVIAEQDIPIEYFRTKTITEINKAAIKDGLKAGSSIPGATLSNPQPNITVRTN